MADVTGGTDSIGDNDDDDVEVSGDDSGRSIRDERDERDTYHTYIVYRLGSITPSERELEVARNYSNSGDRLKFRLLY